MHKILVSWDWDKSQYVWADTPHNLQAVSPTWGHNYKEVLVSEAQLNKLRDGGWIAALVWRGRKGQLVARVKI